MNETHYHSYHLYLRTGRVKGRMEAGTKGDNRDIKGNNFGGEGKMKLLKLSGDRKIKGSQTFYGRFGDWRSKQNGQLYFRQLLGPLKTLSKE